ncbi:FMN reductase [Hyphomicrobium sp. 99]|uniref:FMN reductase n=1 Tax=Hyphomicrobium sp. 99 TaxID=1163419 RepID=UPI0005F7F032|nr:FMN reductase [Hyphomicrobium sp. 99]
MTALSIVGISGSLTNPSRTTVLVDAILKAVAERSGHKTKLLKLSDSAPALFAATSPADVGKDARQFLDLIEGADLLVVGTPVYRASYTGALKHVFDLVDHRRFGSKPVALAATGGSPLHGLVIEHQLRPLFGFLNALTLPTAVYATEGDFSNYAIGSSAIHERIERVANEALIQLTRHSRPASPDAVSPPKAVVA